MSYAAGARRDNALSSETLVDIDRLEGMPLAEGLKDKFIVCANQRLCAITLAKDRQNKRHPFIFAMQPLLKKQEPYSLTDGLKTLKEYEDWFVAKWLEERELRSPRCYKPTIFFLAFASDAPVIRLGTINETEDRGIGSLTTLRFLSPSTWEDEYIAEETKALLHAVTKQNLFSSQKI